MIETVVKTVVVFDICSSTEILEDLLRNNNPSKWRNALIALKEQLSIIGQDLGFIPYKFIGDGWILLFDEDHGAHEILKFLQTTMFSYLINFLNDVRPGLETSPLTGITFGIASGPLIVFEMNETKEYFGRAINLACRLQAATNQLFENYRAKGLIHSVYAERYPKEIEPWRVGIANIPLRNLAGDKPIIVHKIDLFQKALES